MAVFSDHSSMNQVFRDALDSIERRIPHSQAVRELELEINSQEKLRICVDLTFTKVILEEPAKHSLLAQLCKVIGPYNVEWTEEGVVKETTFKKELLSRCQAELDRVKEDDDEVFRLSEAVEAATTSEEKSQLESEHQEIMSRARKRALHLFSFFGELFTVQMVSENMIHECLVCMLCSTFDNEYLECFCNLITNVGKSLDHPKAKVTLQNYFSCILYLLNLDSDGWLF